jgi:hypothetical protein
MNNLVKLGARRDLPNQETGKRASPRARRLRRQSAAAARRELSDIECYRAGRRRKTCDPREAMANTPCPECAFREDIGPNCPAGRTVIQP